eukprot:Gb_11482 [translate_table: standard]
MEPKASSKSTALPYTQIPPMCHSVSPFPRPWVTSYHQCPFHYFSCSSPYNYYSQNWVHLPCIHAHVSTPTSLRCPNCSKTVRSPCGASPTTNCSTGFEHSKGIAEPKELLNWEKQYTQLPAENVSNGSSALTNAGCRPSAEQEISCKAALSSGKCPPVQSPWCFPPMHPVAYCPAFHAPFCSYPQLMPYPWPHGYWHPPCLLSPMRHTSPQPLYPMIGPVPFPSKPGLCTTESGFAGPELNGQETMDGVASLHIDTASENWQGNGKLECQDFRDRGLEYPDELEDGDDEPIFVLTDECLEFFAKSEARRQEKKRQQQKEAKNLRRAARFASKKQDNE